ncbi:MAG: ATP-grasp domain-containing protein [Planctomycetes bacterium]|nr:ATP-grasp domain-containing protein [Planctomycetota bacterium]
MAQKRLMILGAGPFQVYGIQRAVELGYHVITVDYLPENFGHRISHEYVNASTTDIEAVVAAAREKDIDGIATFSSDVATPTVAAVSEALDLPGAHTGVVGPMVDKARFRALQRERGLDGPAFVEVASEADLERVAAMTPPVMFKPVDTSGSRGVTRVDDLSAASIARAYAEARQYSRSSRVCVEEFVEGVEVGGEAFIRDGQIAFVTPTHKHKREFIVTGHSLPTNIDASQQAEVARQVEISCRELGYTNGPVNFDVMVAGPRAVVIELSPRTGGNGIPQLIEHATGFDVYGATARHAVGDPIEGLGDHPVKRPCGSLVFGDLTGGILESVASKDEVRAALPEIFLFFNGYSVGEHVDAFVHGGAGMGYALFDLPQRSYADTVQALLEALHIRTRSDAR